MKISVVIPCYNEEKTIQTIIDKTLNSISHCECEIIIVDDCSTDSSKEIIKAIRNTQIKFTGHSENQGKGAALRTGFQYASGDIVVIQDADLEYNPAEIPKLIQPILVDGVPHPCEDLHVKDPGKNNSEGKCREFVGWYSDTNVWQACVGQGDGKSCIKNNRSRFICTRSNPTWDPWRFTLN